MNLDANPNPRDVLEARLTALLLGELSPEEAAAVRQAIAQDPELARLHERLKQTIALVREATAPASAGQPEPNTAPLQLSPARREALLRRFSQGKPQPVLQPQRKKRTWFAPASLAALLVALAVAGVVLPKLGGPGLGNLRPPALITALPFETLGVRREAPAEETRATRDLTVTVAKPEAARSAAPAPAPESAPPTAQPAPAPPRANIYLPEQAPGTESEQLGWFARQGQPQPTDRFGGLGGFGGGVGGTAQTDATGLLVAGERLGKPDKPAAPPSQLPGPTLAGGWNETRGGLQPVPTLGKPTESRTQSGFARIVTSGPVAFAAGPPPTAAPQPTARPPAPSAPATHEPDRRDRFFFGAVADEANRSEAAKGPQAQAGAVALADTPTLGRLFEGQKEAFRAIPPAQPSREAWRGDESDVVLFGLDQSVEAEKAQAGTAQEQATLRLRLGNELQKAQDGATLKAEPAAVNGRLDAVNQVLGESLARQSAVQAETGARRAETGLQVLSRAAVDQSAPADLSSVRGMAEDSSQQVASELGRKLAEKSASVEKAAADQKAGAVEEDRLLKRPTQAPVPQPEVATAENPFSTFSLNVSDVSFKLAAASLEKGQLPDPATVRSEEFINAFNYRDPDPPPGVPIAFAWERARYPFAHNRELLRLALKTAARGREPGRPLNLVLLLDNSGSMERADRVRIIQECLLVLAAQLKPQDRLSVITFARTARLWIDGRPGPEAARELEKVGQLTPQGGTNLEDAMDLAYQTALRHYLAGGVNRVVLLTDGAANLGNVDPEALKQKVETHRKQGVALDCFGIGWEGYNDDLLEVLSRHGDGRYGFVNTPEEAASEFAGQLAGALQVAASDVKVQVEFNPHRVTSWRQIGYAKHQLTKEQFRDNTVDAAELAAAESGNALYVVQVNPRGDGPLAIVRVRYKVPGTTDYREHEWLVPFTGAALPLEQAGPSLRLAGCAAAFSEWLAANPFAAEVSTDRLLALLRGVPEVFGADPRPKQLEWMIRQARSIAGK